MNKYLIALLLAFSVSPTFASTSSELLQISDAYGAAHFDEIDLIRFTFNIEKGTTTLHRRWEWQPSTDQVTFYQEGGVPESLTYSRKALDTGDAKLNRKVDAWFINDEYWLLFPLHLIWDTDIQVTFNGVKPLPIPPGDAKKLTVTYPSDGAGYTPGDRYDLYYGTFMIGNKEWSRPPDKTPKSWENSDYNIRQWTYHKGAAAAPTMTTTWAGYVRLGPLVIATEHLDATKKFHLWMSELSLKKKNEAIFLQPEAIR